MYSLSDILNYFENTWIGIDHRGRRRPPLFFDRETSRVEQILPRMNNPFECWNRGFDIRINIIHPTVSKLIHIILIEQINSETTLERFRIGF